MTTLTPGANAPLSTASISVTVSYSPDVGADIDVSAFLLGSDSKVRSDEDMCFYGQKTISNGLVQMTEASAGRAVFTLDLSRIEAAVEKVALTATIHETKISFASVSHLSVSVTGGIEAPIPTAGMRESALILGEFYRRQGAWKFRCVAQGFEGGLEPLAKHFGVEVAAAPSPSPSPEPKPAPAPAPAPSGTPASTPTPSRVNLNKITLDKSRSSISLEKKAGGQYGQIRINLNWAQQQTSGFLGFGKKASVDLDLGCLFELQNGRKGVVQALGKGFGAYNQAPFIQLMGDDRTGSVSDGEWLHINGDRWSEIKRIAVFAFIYDGAPNWSATDGVVTLFAPNQAPVEVRVSEEGGKLGCCCIALLENIGGDVKVTRRVDFHRDQEKLDHAYQWGLSWRVGSK
ncbi:TerD family protein [Halopseudomonas pelagia]|uniref:Tellurium resistance protein TerA n=1 Tax=Halopseudomonas pelagia TaxID=553151 RepID=A0AA91Z5P1_9GAMM|nr:TerD family protein [Halopseudomonas pelagia]PCC99197.1 tellurium resistance protein TerA [Halopseudomonas pelagia]QFY57030.1 tellurium resistance protein TerA [Halopseudomonas pelagia]